MRYSFIIFFLFLSGCSSQKADIYFQHKTLLGTIESYSLFPRNSSFSEQQNISDGLRNSIEIEIENSFEAKGFYYQPIEKAQVIVSYQLLGKNYKSYKDKQLGKGLKQGCKDCTSDLPQRKRRGKQQQDSFEKKETEAITIRLLESKSRRTLWHASYPLQISTDDYNLAVQEKVRYAIKQLIKSLPPVSSTAQK